MSLLPFAKQRQQREQKKLIERELNRVRELIDQQIDEFDPHVKPYVEVICNNPGKMLRPALALLTAQATGGIKPEHITFAALLEMTHMASLIHDDVLDKADTRRERPTANALWGNNLAVLLGDVLLSQAMMTGSQIGDQEFCAHMARTVRDLCQGEVEQSTRLWDAEMPREEYFELIRKKTATLFSAATKGVAMLQGLPVESVEQLDRIGTQLGICYQIYDDILDLTGKDKAAGKTLGTDATKGKLTLPFFYMLESDDPALVAYLKDCVAKKEEIKLGQLRSSRCYKEAICASITEGKARNAEARNLLHQLPDTEARQALCDFSHHLDDLMDNCNS